MVFLLFAICIEFVIYIKFVYLKHQVRYVVLICFNNVLLLSSVNKGLHLNKVDLEDINILLLCSVFCLMKLKAKYFKLQAFLQSSKICTRYKYLILIWNFFVFLSFSAFIG